ncbi:MAG: nucleotidyltransferase [Candidatus Omnitrophica bacterium]|nr:nucleotidyltransferase [Candidatus Omnitrophota bacterium]
MIIPSDYKELLKILNRHRVKYLIVGAYAVIHYTEPRYTKDLDIWVKPEEENARRAYEALKEFGAPLKNIAVADFMNQNLVYQMGVEPVRVDILAGIAAMHFDTAYKHRKIASFDGIKVNVIGINELVEAKRNTKRPMDAMDVAALRCRLKQNKKI